MEKQDNEVTSTSGPTKDEENQRTDVNSAVQNVIRLYSHDETEESKPKTFSQNDLHDREDLKSDDAHRLWEIVNEVNKRTSRIKTEFFELGRVLTEAKEILGHGRFIEFCRDNFDFSYPSANNFMNVYKHCMGNPEVVQTIKPSVLYKITSPNFPKDLREYLFENHHSLNDISNKTINWVCKQLKEKRININSPEIQKMIDFRKKTLGYCEYNDKIESQILELEKFFVSVANLALKLSPWPSGNLALDKSQARRIEHLWNNICGAAAKALPQSYTPLDDSEVEPEPLEAWGHPALRGAMAPENHRVKITNWNGDCGPILSMKMHQMRTSWNHSKKKTKPDSWFAKEKRTTPKPKG